MREIRTGICRKVQKDHRGMSLVEVIVAITILGIVAVPVLHSLTTAMVYNQKARIRQEMTLTAESIMETFKGYSLDELKTRFTSGGAGIEGVKLATPTDTEVYDPNPDTGTGFHYKYDAPNPSDPTVVGGAYTFNINEMKAENGQFYDVTITATPNSVEKVMEPKNAETTRDAIFQGNRKWDKNAVKEVKSDFANYKTGLEGAFEANAVVKINDTVTAVQGNMDKLFNESAASVYVGNYLHLHERTLTFEITVDGDDYKVTPKMVYRYYLKDYPYYVRGVTEPSSDEYPGSGGSHGSSGNVEESIGTSKNLDRFPADGSFLEYKVDLTASDPAGGPSYSDGYIYKNRKKAGLNRLMIYYYPQYNLDAGHDKIVIDNQAGITGFQCYILKQRAADINDSTTKIKENSYRASVEIKNSASGFEVFHNFDDNIADGSSTTAPSISGTYEKIYSFTKEVSGTTTPELVAKYEEKEVLSYKVELTVEQNDREITKLESTMNEKIEN